MVWDWTTVVICTICTILIGLFLLKIPRLFLKPSIAMKGKTLIVIAHPDDESMFFGPTIIRLKSQVKHLQILSLSRGDFDGNGEIRTIELATAAQVFGIDDVCIIDDARLLDGSSWDESVIREMVEPIVEKERVQNVITFDDYGVSGHLNHRSVHRALRSLPESVQVYYLESVSIFRKYLAVIDVFITILFHSFSSKNRLIQLASVVETTTIMTALKKHSSQMVWFRKLYMMFSRYMIVNTLIPRPSSSKSSSKSPHS